MLYTNKPKEFYVPSKNKILTPEGGIITPEANIVTTSTVLQAGPTARQWLAGLMQGIWQGGNSWLTLEVGISSNAVEAVPSKLGSPVLRKLIDSVIFTLADGITVANGPTTTLQLNASLQTPDANGLTITEYGIYGSGLNLNQAPFGTGLLILYSTITPYAKTAASTVQFQVIINT